MTARTKGRATNGRAGLAPPGEDLPVAEFAERGTDLTGQGHGEILMPGVICFVRADTLLRADYQRKLQELRVNRMARRLDPRLLGVLLVAERAGGIYVIDGEHRQAAVIQAGYGALRMRCLLIETNSYTEEAELFVLGNARDNTKPLATGEVFHARLEQGDRRALAIKDIADQQGITLDLMMSASTTAGDTVRAIATLERIYRNGGPEHLTDVLVTIIDCFPSQRDALIHSNLMGFHQFLWRYHNLVDRAVLRHTLRAVTIDGLNARALMAKAAGWRKRTDSGILVGQAILDIYNDQRQARNRLPRWEIVAGPMPWRGDLDLQYVPRPLAATVAAS